MGRNRPTDPPMTDIEHRNRAFLLPVEDTEFLLRDELRGARFMLEYEKAELSLRDWGVRSTIIAFGSARTPSPEQADAELRAARDTDAVKRAERRLLLSRYCQEARNFGRIVSLRGGALCPEGGIRDNVMATGGGPGIMEAANRGACDAGAPSIGFNISLPHEQRPSPYSTPELTFQFHYFAMRKMHFAMRANALVVFPGGFGTFDELFEILTLEQTRKAPPVPVVLLGRSYWQRIINVDALVEEGAIDADDLALFSMVDTAEEAWSELVRRGLKAHTPPDEAPTNGD